MQTDLYSLSVTQGPGVEAFKDSGVFACEDVKTEQKTGKWRRGYGSGENDNVLDGERDFFSDSDSVWHCIKDMSNAAGMASK